MKQLLDEEERFWIPLCFAFGLGSLVAAFLTGKIPF